MNRLKQVPNHSRLRELILRICRHSESDPGFGAIKLNKLLFFCDFAAFVKYGKSITGQQYVKQEFGPVPKEMPQILKRMEKRRWIASREQEVTGGYKQRRYIALRDGHISDFSKEELALVHGVLDSYRNFNAMEISSTSHGFIGWKASELREDIPYGTALWCPTVLNERVIKHGKSLEVAARKAFAA